MIKLTKWSGSAFFLNAWHIEQVEEAPDTIILLTNGKKYIVKESAEEVVFKCKQFFRDIANVSVSAKKGADSNE